MPIKLKFGETQIKLASDYKHFMNANFIDQLTGKKFMTISAELLLPCRELILRI